MLNSDMSPWSFCKIYTVTVSKTIDKMIDRQPCGLHKWIDNHWPNEPKTALHHVLANGFCFGTSQGNISWISKSVYCWFKVHIAPHIVTEWSKIFSYLQLNEKPVILISYTICATTDEKISWSNLPSICIWHCLLCTSLCSLPA